MPNLHLWIQPTADHVVLYYVVTEKNSNIRGPTLSKPVLVKESTVYEAKIDKMKGETQITTLSVRAINILPSAFDRSRQNSIVI